jgi:N-acyl-D-aspartate/D-glutamate deacylase
VADVVVLNPAAFHERGTVDQPNQLATGVQTVIVNGQIALNAGRATGVRAGQVLRR